MELPDGASQRYIGLLCDDLKHDFTVDPTTIHELPDDDPRKYQLTYEVAELLSQSCTGKPVYIEHERHSTPSGKILRIWPEESKLFIEMDIDGDAANDRISRGKLNSLSLGHQMVYPFNASNTYVVECTLCTLGQRDNSTLLGYHKGKPGQVEVEEHDTVLHLPPEYKHHATINDDNYKPSRHTYIAASKSPYDGDSASTLPPSILTVFPQSRLTNMSQPDTVDMEQDDRQTQQQQQDEAGAANGEEEQQQEQEEQEQVGRNNNRTRPADLPPQKSNETPVDYWTRLVQDPKHKIFSKYARSQLALVMKNLDEHNKALEIKYKVLENKYKDYRLHTLDATIPYIERGQDKHPKITLQPYIAASVNPLSPAPSSSSSSVQTTTLSHIKNHNNMGAADISPIEANIAQLAAEHLPRVNPAFKEPSNGQVSSDQAQQQQHPRSEQLLILQEQRRIQELKVKEAELLAAGRRQQPPPRNKVVQKKVVRRGRRNDGNGEQDEDLPAEDEDVEEEQDTQAMDRDQDDDQGRPNQSYEDQSMMLDDTEGGNDDSNHHHQYQPEQNRNRNKRTNQAVRRPVSDEYEEDQNNYPTKQNNNNNGQYRNTGRGGGEYEEDEYGNVEDEEDEDNGGGNDDRRVVMNKKNASIKPSREERSQLFFKSRKAQRQQQQQQPPQQKQMYNNGNNNGNRQSSYPPKQRQGQGQGQGHTPLYEKYRAVAPSPHSQYKKQNIQPNAYVNPMKLREPGTIPRNVLEGVHDLTIKASNIHREIRNSHVRNVVARETHPALSCLYGNMVNWYPEVVRNPSLAKVYGQKSMQQPWEKSIDGMTNFQLVNPAHNSQVLGFFRDNNIMYRSV